MVHALNFTVCFLLIALFVLSVFKIAQSGVNFNVSKFINLEGFGISGLLSLMVLPLMWQFVDLTNWQRLLSVKPNQEGDRESLYGNIRRGLLVYAIESPFTWLIFLFFGLLAVTSMPDVGFTDLLIDIPKHLVNSSSVLQNVVGYTFIISVLSIMLSTIDSFIVGAIFTFVYDSHKQSRDLLDRKDKEEGIRHYSRITNTGKVFGLIAILCGLLLFIIFDQNIANGGEMFINLLLAFYSAQLSFFPLIFGILFLKRRPNALWANASMIAGAIAGIGLGIYAVLWNPDYAWYPILVCVSTSTSIVLLGLLFQPYAKQRAT